MKERNKISQAVNFEELKRSYGQIPFGNTTIELSEIMDDLVGSFVVLKQIENKIKEKLGKEVGYGTSNPLFRNAHLFYEIDWDENKMMYKIGEAFNELPVVFLSPNLINTKMVVVLKADEFSRSNPDWIIIPLEKQLERY